MLVKAARVLVKAMRVLLVHEKASPEVLVEVVRLQEAVSVPVEGMRVLFQTVKMLVECRVHESAYSSAYRTCL